MMVAIILYCLIIIKCCIIISDEKDIVLYTYINNVALYIFTS